MPLQDPFKKKTPTSEMQAPQKLAQAPSPEDLRFSMLKAQREVGRPIILSWKDEEDDTFLLTCTMAEGAKEPTWILHVGHEEDSAIVWIYTTSDTALIHGMIGTIGQEQMPKIAQVPEEPKIRITGSGKGEQEFDAQQPLPHEEFADKYDLVSRLGHGGMGVIYKAKRVDDGELVALKVLHSHLLNDVESKKRFELEAAACRDLKHRNIIEMKEFGFSKHGQPYMIMEYLEGKSLTDIIEKRGRLEVRRFINIFTQICDGLNHAHKKGVVHRDVKPSNVMIIKSEAGVDIAKILDFGIAKRHMEENRDNLTPTGNVLGSPAYIAPEQCAGAEADPRSDIYSLGCVMYEALTGAPPFVHDSAIKVLLMQLSEQPKPLSVACPDAEFPLELETIMMRCLEKDPAARYQNASELGAELWTFAATGQRGIIPDPVAENSEAPLAKEAAAAGEMLSRLDYGPPPSPVRTSVHVPPPPVIPPPPPIPMPMQMQAIPGTVPVPMPASIEAQLERLKKTLTIRFKRFRSPFELEVLWEGLNLARNLQARDVNVSILFDLESVCLVLDTEVVASRFNLDAAMVKKLNQMQEMVKELMENGATLIATERWAKRGDSLQHLIDGVEIVGDDEYAELMIERFGAIIEF